MPRRRMAIWETWPSARRAPAQQAETFGHSIERELAFLTVHGTLHLLGYDHIRPDDERQMRALQTEILKEMGLQIK